ncbi:MAG: endopeptidase La [Deltaproteobacteria bacterium]|nr:endopeptidase La [Deltaproteobacteria bacterium]MCL5792840.1 endopeptidase La [Deltaproteobacteria bacterium]
MTEEIDLKQENEQQPDRTKIPDELPLVPIRDVVLFPNMILPLFVGREASISAIDYALTKERLVVFSTQKNMNEESPLPEGIYETGTVGSITRMLKLPDGRVKILIQGLSRVHIKEYKQQKPFYLVSIDVIQEEPVTETVEIQALIRTVKEQLEKVVAMGKPIQPDALILLENITDPGRIADIIVTNYGLKTAELQTFLETVDPVQRLKSVMEIQNKEMELLTLQAKIQSHAREEMGKVQREYFLREQLKAIKSELGEIDEKAREIQEFRDKIKKAKMPKDVEEEAQGQVNRLEMMHPDSAEASIVRTYLEWLTEIPWSKKTKENIDIKHAKSILDVDHYDLEKVKERILEYLSVRRLKKKAKGPILCFVGPPGVGKTSLGKSIARALNRKFVRMSLGGIRDEAEIRGHRRTYIGAMPGRIIQGIKQIGTKNPVYMLDEIDKIGVDFRGDPSAALLEVLDPEQNFSFSDNYLGVPFDLSDVLFIATANMMDPVPPALKDRMEVISLAGYTDEEKLRIAQKFIISRQGNETGVGKNNVKFEEAAILFIINNYTKEAGLRNLEREIATIFRKVAQKIAEGEKPPFNITKNDVRKYLGAPKIPIEDLMYKDEIGVATGLAWTPYGGDVLYIEVIIMKGKGRLTLTGQLGDVMKESAMAAVSYLRSKATELGINDGSFFDRFDIHIHVPAGAIPKDGPSAGITMAVATASALTRKKVRRDVAMTGEITLRGNVLPIGGLKEKSLAALRAKIYRVIMPEANKPDLEELPDYVKDKITFIPVKHISEVLEQVLLTNKKSTHSKNDAKNNKKLGRDRPHKKN